MTLVQQLTKFDGNEGLNLCTNHDVVRQLWPHNSMSEKVSQYTCFVKCQVAPTTDIRVLK